METGIILLISIAGFMIAIIVLVKFFQIARDVSTIRQIAEERADKEREAERKSEQKGIKQGGITFDTPITSEEIEEILSRMK
jgi:hypothetical protein